MKLRVWIRRCALAVALACCSPGLLAAGFGFILIPAAPLAYEPAFIEVLPGDGAYGDCFDDSRNRVTMTGNVIRVDLRLRPSFEPPGRNCRTFAGLGSLPAGNYVIEVWYEGIGKQGEKQFTVAPMPDPAQGNLRPIINVSGLYWNPQRPGRGMSITQDPLTQNLFAVWYIYDQARQPTFYTFQCEGWSQSRGCRGKIYRVTGQYFGDLTLPSNYEATEVGIFALGCQAALGVDMSCGFNATIEGISLFEPMVRLRF